jgi:hypothetical protein
MEFVVRGEERGQNISDKFAEWLANISGYEYNKTMIC